MNQTWLKIKERIKTWLEKTRIAVRHATDAAILAGRRAWRWLAALLLMIKKRDPLRSQRLKDRIRTLRRPKTRRGSPPAVNEEPTGPVQIAADSALIQLQDSDQHPLQVRAKKKKIPPIRRTSRQKVYRLKGYTTVAKINRKNQMEMQQQFLRKILVFISLILVLIILFHLYNPFRDLSEWYRIIGISDISDLTEDNPLFPELTEPTSE